MKFPPYSQNRIKTYRECKKRFYKRYKERIEEASNQFMVEGKEAHKAIENYLSKETKGSNEEFNKFSERALSYIEGFIPLSFEYEIKNDDFHGKIDFIGYDDNANLVVIDWKTGHKLDDDDFQAKFYAYLLYKQNDFPIIEGITVKIINLRYSKIQHEEFYTKEFLESYGEIISEAIKEIEENKKWNPSVGSHCNYCQFQLSHCNAWKDYSLLPISVLGERYLALEKYLAKMKQAIQDTVSINGSLPANGGRFEISSKEKVIPKDKEKLFDLLLENEDLPYTDMFYLKETIAMKAVLEQEKYNDLTELTRSAPRLNYVKDGGKDG